MAFMMIFIKFFSQHFTFDFIELFDALLFLFETSHKKTKKTTKIIMLDIEEYAKAKGIPVESIPADVFQKAQEKSLALRQTANPKAESFKKSCIVTEELFKTCASDSDSGVRLFYRFNCCIATYPIIRHSNVAFQF